MTALVRVSRCWLRLVSASGQASASTARASCQAAGLGFLPHARLCSPARLAARAASASEWGERPFETAGGLEGPQGIFRPCQAPDAADAGCIGKSGNAAGAEKTRGTDPPGGLKRSLRRTEDVPQPVPGLVAHCHPGGGPAPADRHRQRPGCAGPTLSRSVAARQVFAAMCDKLLDIGCRATLRPQLATGWEWQEEGRALRLTLRPGVVFQDGAAMDAAAVVAGLRRHLDTPGSTRRGELGPGGQRGGDRAAGGDDPAGDPLRPAAGGAVGPRRDDRLPPRRPPGRGIRPGACLRRGRSGWCAGSPRTGSSWSASPAIGCANIHVDRVTYRPIPDTTVRAANLRAGALEVIERVLPSDVAELRADRRVVLTEAPSSPPSTSR